MDFEMENSQDHGGLAIQQHQVAADDDVLAIRRRRREFANKFDRRRLDPLAQSRREGAAFNELPFESRRQLVSLGQAGRQMVLMIGVPRAKHFAVVIVVGIILVVVAITMLFLVLSAALRQREAACPRESAHGNCKKVWLHFHGFLLKMRGLEFQVNARAKRRQPGTST